MKGSPPRIWTACRSGITGNVTIPLLGKDSFQEVDITGITMPVTKHNFIVKDVNDLPRRFVWRFTSPRKADRVLF